MSYRLVALDLDGTLLGPDQKISKDNCEVLKKLHKKGVYTVVVTGRSFAAARPYVLEMGIGDVPIVTHNGALVKMSLSCDLLGCSPLSGETAIRAVKLATRENIRISLSDEPHGLGRIVLDQEPMGRFLEYLKKSGSPYYLTKSFLEHLEHMSAAGKDPIHLTFSGPCKEVDSVEVLLQEQLTGDYRFLKTAYRKRNLTMGDLVSSSVSKASGLHEVVKHFDLSSSDVLAIGDNENDLDMLRYAGKGVLMGNADQRLMEPGFELTGTNIEHGVAQALERWVLRA